MILIVLAKQEPEKNEENASEGGSRARSADFPNFFEVTVNNN